MSLAVISWTCALVAIAVYYFRVNNWPNNLIPTMLILDVAAVGLAPLALVGSQRQPPRIDQPHRARLVPGHHLDRWRIGN